MRSSDNHLTITWGQFPVTLKFHSYLPGDNELIHWMSWLTYQMVRSMGNELTFWPMWEPQEHDSFCEARILAATTLKTTATTRGNQAESEILLDRAARGHRNLAMINGYMLRKLTNNPNDQGSVTARRGHSSVTARSQLNHGIFSMITAQSWLGHSSITAQVTAQSRLAVIILVTVSSPWAVTVANFFLMG